MGESTLSSTSILVCMMPVKKIKMVIQKLSKMVIKIKNSQNIHGPAYITSLHFILARNLQYQIALYWYHMEHALNFQLKNMHLCFLIIKPRFTFSCAWAILNHTIARYSVLFFPFPCLSCPWIVLLGRGKLEGRKVMI